VYNHLGWNGRFMGNGCGGCAGDNAVGANRPVALGFAAGATDAATKAPAAALPSTAAAEPDWPPIRNLRMSAFTR
jgi:hypothetical protein